MRILLTGATGLLGSHLLQLGLELGFQFSLPVRSINKRSYLYSIQRNPDINIYDFDFSPINLDQIFMGVDYVINAAALSSPFEEDREKMREINVEFPKNLYHWSSERGVKKFIHISSSSVLGLENHEDFLDEGSFKAFRSTPYAETKREINNWLLEQTGCPPCLIYPGYMLDSYDARPSSGALFFALKMGKFKYYTSGTKNIVSARDVATGIFKAIQNGNSNAYILGGENIGIKETLQMICGFLGLDFENLTQVSRDEISQYEIEREFCLTSPLSIEKANTELHYQPKDKAKDAIRNALEWFEKQRLLRPKL